MLKSLKLKESQTKQFGMSLKQDSPLSNDDPTHQKLNQVISSSKSNRSPYSKKNNDQLKSTFQLKTQISEYYDDQYENQAQSQQSVSSIKSIRAKNKPKSSSKKLFIKIIICVFILVNFFLFTILNFPSTSQNQPEDKQLTKRMEIMNLQMNNKKQRITIAENKYNSNSQQKQPTQNLSQQKLKNQLVSPNQRSDLPIQKTQQQQGNVQFVDSQNQQSLVFNDLSLQINIQITQIPLKQNKYHHQIKNEQTQALNKKEISSNTNKMISAQNTINSNIHQNNQIQHIKNQQISQPYDHSLYDQTYQQPRTGNLRNPFPQTASSIMLEKENMIKDEQNKSQNMAKQPIPGFPMVTISYDPAYPNGNNAQIPPTPHPMQIPQALRTQQNVVNQLSLPIIPQSASPQVQLQVKPPIQPHITPQIPQPQIQSQIQSQLPSTCPEYILKEQNQKGRLYRFAIQHRLLRQYSHVDSFYDQITTQITRQKFSQAVDLLEIVHHVDKNGNILVQDNPCYSAEFFQTKIKDIISKQHQRLNNQYQIDTYHNRQLRFCLVVNSYNNARNGLIYRNIDSILQQNYTNYHVVYTDDASPDLTGQQVRKYLSGKNVDESKFKVKINPQKIGMMENIFNAITYDCQEGEIAVMLDGDDSFIGTNVLSLLNTLYQKERVAMMWNNFLEIEENSRILMGFSRDLDDYQKSSGHFRATNKFVSSHLKSFYVDLFRKIKPDDLKYDDTKKFFGGASDTAMMFNMIEMAYPNYCYIPEIVYEYRFDTGQVGMTVNRAAQQKALQKIAFQKPYQRLRDFSFVDRAIETAMVI